MHYTESLFEKLKRLEDTPGTNDKLSLVTLFDPQELRLAAMAVDPAVNFFISKVPVHGIGGTEQWDGGVEALLANLSTRALTGNAARDAIVATLSRLNRPARELACRILLKDLKCKVGVTLINKAFPGTIVEYPYMRCSLPDKSNMPKWSVKDWADGMLSQLKADGMFASLTTTTGGVRLVSRQGSPFPSDAIPDLFKIHEPLIDKQLHGELVVYRNGELLERQISNGILNSLLQGGELDEGDIVVYEVWDMIPVEDAVPGGSYSLGYLLRLADLRSAVEHHPVVSVIETRVVYSKDEAYAHYFEVLGRGLEGIIVKHPDGIWKDTTSKDCVKLKLEVDVELRGKAFTPGSGKNADTFGSVTMTSEDDLLEVDVAGWTDAARADLWARREKLSEIIFTVRANQILNPGPNNEKHSLFLPRVIEERKDKRVADTLQQIKDQFAAAVKKS